MATTPRPVIDSVVRSICGREVERLVRLTGGGLHEAYRVDVRRARGRPDRASAATVVHGRGARAKKDGAKTLLPGAGKPATTEEADLDARDSTPASFRGQSEPVTADVSGGSVIIVGVGALIEFSCPGCGYAAEVSGGPDMGMLVATQTMICFGCRTLVDVTTGPSLSLQPPTAKRRRCPRCRSRRFEPWGRIDDPETDWPLTDRSPGVPAEARFDCPNCGETMTQGEVVASWD
jgi:predicted RNA-binding Zn-ribbon protein involved in translation (DUF1610 family)